MATSIFDNKILKPVYGDVQRVLGEKIVVWKHLIYYLENKYKIIKNEWKFYTRKSGWCLRISNDDGKNIVFLIPNKNYFIVTINMGVKIKEEVLKTKISFANKKIIEDAEIYMEGISVLIPIKEQKDLADIKTILSVRDNV